LGGINVEGLIGLVVIILLGIMTWNLKVGLERIEKKLGNISDALKEK
jgi:hypothetical protein